MLDALRSRNFRLLWLSQSVSVIGDALIIVAIGLYVTRLTHRPGDVGLVLGAYALPLVLFILIGGVIADRLPRQVVMLSSDIVRAVLHGVLAVLIATGTVRIWHMVVIGLLVVMSSPGPVFYAHRRLRRNGLSFSMWKFRTMCENSAEVLEHYLAKHPKARTALLP